MDGTINTAGARPVDTAHNVDVASKVEENYSHISTRNPDGTWSRTYYSNGNGSQSSWAKLGNVQKASKLIGIPVKNLQGETLGKVENLTVALCVRAHRGGHHFLRWLSGYGQRVERRAADRTAV